MDYHRNFIALVAVACWASSAVWAANGLEGTTHDGRFVSLSGEKLTMTDTKGAEHTHVLAFDAKVTCDGQDCKATDLKAGMKIRVITKDADKKVAVSIEAIDKNEMFANTRDGKFVRLTGQKLQMTDANGKEHTHTLAKGAIITCDGIPCKAEELKGGMKIRVRTEKNDPSVAIRVDAIDKGSDF